MMRVALLLSLALVALAGCRAPRVVYEREVVTVQQPAPPPTVVRVTDTVRVATPPPTLAATRDSLGIPSDARPTQPVRVVTLPAQRDPLWGVPRFFGLTVDSARVRLQLDTGDAEFLRPAPGETLSVYPHPDGSLAADLTGQPVGAALRVEVPAPRIVQQVVYPPLRLLAAGLLLVAGVFAAAALARALR